MVISCLTHLATQSLCLLAYRAVRHFILKCGCIRNVFTLISDDHVPLLQSTFLCRPSFDDISNESSLGHLYMMRLCQFWGEILDADAQPTLSTCRKQSAFSRREGHVAGDGEADALKTPGFGCNRSVDPDYLPFQVQ